MGGFPGPTLRICHILEGLALLSFACLALPVLAVAPGHTAQSRFRLSIQSKHPGNHFGFRSTSKPNSLLPMQHAWARGKVQTMLIHSLGCAPDAPHLPDLPLLILLLLILLIIRVNVPNFLWTLQEMPQWVIACSDGRCLELNHSNALPHPNNDIWTHRQGSGSRGRSWPQPAT